jgi:hypothetical protein
MENLLIQGTKYTPYIAFDDRRNILTIKGYSYPENAAAFYEPVMSWLTTYLEQPHTRPFEIDLELIYFNSSSSKILLDLFDLLDQYARQGCAIVVNWIYHEDNESAYECGVEFEEDIQHLQFRLVKKT